MGDPKVMTRTQYLLTKLAEEASEISQIALKSQQFGLKETRTGQPYSNEQRIHHELHDLFAIVQMLNAEADFGYHVDPDWVDQKIIKTNHFYNYAKDLGHVE